MPFVQWFSISFVFEKNIFHSFAASTWRTQLCSLEWLQVKNQSDLFAQGKKNPDAWIGFVMVLLQWLVMLSCSWCSLHSEVNKLNSNLLGNAAFRLFVHISLFGLSWWHVAECVSEMIYVIPFSERHLRCHCWRSRAHFLRAIFAFVGLERSEHFCSLAIL